MAETMLTLCPNCGRRVHTGQYDEQITCPSCKQVSKIRNPWANMHHAVQQPQQMVVQQVVSQKPREGKLVWVLIITGLVLATLGAVTFGVILPRIEAANRPPPPPDFLVDASSVPDQLVRVLGFPAMVQRLTIYSTHAEVEAWNADEKLVKRYLVRPEGTTERRGGKSERTAAFDASELDFGRVASMVSNARSTAETKDAEVHSVVAERREDGQILWRVNVSGKGGVHQVDYDKKGNRLEPKPQ
jgi:DNA-directed RNA polymerase subunit RPC12/RpoP